MTDGEELSDLSALKERKVDEGLAISRVLLHAGEYFKVHAEQARMFDVRGALTEPTGVLPRGAQQGDIINIARSYGREMYILTILQRVWGCRADHPQRVEHRLEPTQGQGRNDVCATCCETVEGSADHRGVR